MSDSMIDLKNEWVNLLQSAKRVFQQISIEKTNVISFSIGIKQ